MLLLSTLSVYGFLQCIEPSVPSCPASACIKSLKRLFWEQRCFDWMCFIISRNEVYYFCFQIRTWELSSPIPILAFFYLLITAGADRNSYRDHRREKLGKKRVTNGDHIWKISYLLLKDGQTKLKNKHIFFILKNLLLETKSEFRSSHSLILITFEQKSVGFWKQRGW